MWLIDRVITSLQDATRALIFLDEDKYASDIEDLIRVRKAIEEKGR